MAAAAVAGLIPVLHSVAGDKSGYYIGRQLWFGLIGMYGVVVYVVRMPWAHVHEDFWCHGNITYPCRIECFERSFSRPVTGTWYFFYFIFLALFFLMEFFMAQVRHKQVRVKSAEALVGEAEEGSMLAVQEHVPAPKKSLLNFHREKMLLLLYLLHFLLQVAIQGVFLVLLLFQHLPVVSQTPIPCSTPGCPGPFLCLIRATTEKRMSIYTLVTLSFMIILFCLGFFAYSIHHYLLEGMSIAKFMMGGARPFPPNV
ncbi:gap junction beta-4 protein-like [Dipodomys merriami]|uniref:gap junction beta-4 protein-like n=1 Tax=Dipodomys merriami TaxID=94247 RepID=UPI0038559D85